MYHDFQKQFMVNVLDESYMFDDDKIKNLNSGLFLSQLFKVNLYIKKTFQDFP